MNDMIERVAEAICNQTFRESGPFLWKRASPKFKSEYLSRARAAIVAMREPTEEYVLVSRYRYRTSSKSNAVWKDGRATDGGNSAEGAQGAATSADSTP